MSKPNAHKGSEGQAIRTQAHMEAVLSWKNLLELSLPHKSEKTGAWSVQGKKGENGG